MWKYILIALVTLSPSYLASAEMERDQISVASTSSGNGQIYRLDTKTGKYVAAAEVGRYQIAVSSSYSGKLQLYRLDTKTGKIVGCLYVWPDDNINKQCPQFSEEKE